MQDEQVTPEVTEPVDMPLEHEPLADVDPVDVVEGGAPSGDIPAQHGEWVDAAADDPAFTDAPGGGQGAAGGDGAAV